MKCTRYFIVMRQRPDRRDIPEEWIVATMSDPARTVQQADGRWRCWRAIPEAGGRYLRVVRLDDRETVHNAFFDRDFVP